MNESRPIRKGRRRDKPNRGKLRRWLLILLILLATGLLVYGGVTVYRTQPQISEHARLTGIGETFVRHQISNEFQVNFSPEEETGVEPENGKYRVQGWVDIIRKDGSIIRQNFSCLIYKNTWGDWVGEDVSLIEQM